MKLVRLESETELTQSQFTNNLAIPLVIGKNGQVALKCLTLQFAEPPFIIDSTNNQISFTTSSITGSPVTTLRTITIPNGEYNITNLMLKIQELLNAMIQSEVTPSTDDGFEWLVEAKGDAEIGLKTHIAFQRTDPEAVTTANTQILQDGTNATMDYSEPNFFKDVTDDGTYNAGLITSKWVNTGAWRISMVVTKKSGTQTEDIADSKWVFGIADIPSLQTDGETSLLEEIYVGFYRNNDGQYSYKKNDVMVDTNIDIEAEDVITISKRLVSGTQTKVLYTIQKGLTVTHFEGDVIQESDVRFIGAGGMVLLLKVGNDTGKIAFNTIENNPTTQIVENTGVYTRINASDVKYVLLDNNLTVSASNVTLDLKSDALKQLLGYNLQFMEKNAVSYDFVSESNIATNVFNNDIVVEIPELSLDGYDHGVRQSRNIAMVISSGELISSQKAIGFERYELTYNEQATFLFIGLKNKQTSVTCPQLTIRVTSNGQVLPLSGKMTALLLFRDEDDKMY
jgi:hypothetical protein